jgi:hypothetical protein
VIWFLVARRHRDLDDPALSRLADLMLAYLAFQLIVFAAVIFIMDKLYWGLSAA